MPSHLAQFRMEDWEVGPPPAWWDDPVEFWPYFKARLLHLRARRAWLDARGLP